MKKTDPAKKHAKKPEKGTDKVYDNSHLVPGYGRMSKAQADKNGWPSVKICESPEQVVTMTIPFLIRVMEYAREDAKTDMDLHVAAEKMAELGDLSMSDYDKVFK